MSTENTQATGTGDVSRTESFEAYEARFLANTSAVADEDQATEEEAEAESADKIASDSETDGDPEQDSDEETENEEQDGKPKGKGKGGFQRKIDKLTGKVKDLEAQLAAKPAGTATETKSEPPPAATFDKPKPKLDDFEDVEGFTEALTDWKLESKEFEKSQSAKQEAAKKEADSLIEAWNTRVAKAKGEHADYERVMKAASGIDISPAHQRIILESEHGAEIAYKLASDHAELKKFAGMSPLAAAKHLGKLEAALPSSATTAQTQKTSSRAPAPPRTVNARGANVAVDPTDPALAADYEKWERARNAQLRKRRG